VKLLIEPLDRVRTTVDLPRDLLDRSRSIVDRKLAKNQNVLFTAALAEYLDRLDQQAIDDQFAGMAHDAAYQELNRHLVEEFASADYQDQLAGDESP
jgi:metal-responsive CopG/Arc/MetJ family transcriptional regulator